MRLGTVIQFIGWLLVFLAVAMLVPTLVAFGSGDKDLGLAFGICSILTIFVGFGMVATYRGSAPLYTLNEGLLLVVISWIVVPFVAGFPLALTDGIPTLLDAWFEAVSGLTTTGATLITDFENTPMAILLWRSILQWLGGIYILLMAMHILVVIGATTLPIKRVKLPAPEVFGGGEDLKSRILHSIVAMFIIYIVLTLITFVTIWLGGIPGLEALCLAMSTVSTGGFSTRAGPIDIFEAPLAEFIMIVVMIVSSMNFVIHWHGIRGRFKEYAKVPELQYFSLILIATVLGIWATSAIAGGGSNLWNAIFNGVSLLSTTGFYLEEGGAISNLPPVLILVPLMIGGAALSTTGGFKVVRFVLLIKHSNREMKRLGHPHGLFPIRFGEYRISEMTMDAVLALFLGFMSLTAAVAFIIGWSGFEFEVAIIAAASSVMNAGPFLLASTGGVTTYADFPVHVRTALAVGMIVGRIEVLAFLVILNVNFWRR
jgi:trk/ktr system potassium uptake protein